MSQHNLHSSYREKLIEHLFIGELLKLSWQQHSCELEIAQPEVDNSGYDLIAECYGIVRHIQLKASHLESSTNVQKVHVKLADKPSGCIVWVIFDEHTLTFDHFLYFGDIAGEPLPNISELKIAKHAKGNAEGIKLERPSMRIVKKSNFVKINSCEELFTKLFEIQVAESSPQNTTQKPTLENDFLKIHRIKLWAERSHQKNSQLIQAFLHLEERHGAVQFNELIDYCMQANGGTQLDWVNNFNSMKTDQGNSHGKVFYLDGLFVNLYSQVRAEIDNYFARKIRD